MVAEKCSIFYLTISPPNRHNNAPHSKNTQTYFFPSFLSIYFHKPYKLQFRNCCSKCIVAVCIAIILIISINRSIFISCITSYRKFFAFSVYTLVMIAIQKNPIAMVIIAPIQNAHVILFHFLRHCSSSFSNCLKYFR